MVEALIQRAGHLTVDEAADLYHARAARLLIDGDANRRALKTAGRTAARLGHLPEYERARHAAVTAWRSALPEVQGPWLIVGTAIADAAGALVLGDYLERDAARTLIGPWQQAIGSLVPVGPGVTNGQRRVRHAQELIG